MNILLEKYIDLYNEMKKNDKNFIPLCAAETYISELVKKSGLDINILGGSIDELTDASIGHLLIEFLGSDEARNNAIVWLKDNKIEVEEI